MTLGERIAQLRCRQGLSIDTLAARAGINLVTLRSYENNKSCPSVRLLLKLCQHLNTSIDALLQGVTLPADARNNSKKEKSYVY